MVQKLKIYAIGSSFGAIFPKNMLEHMHIKEGDEIFAIETDRGVLLTPYDPHFEAGMEAFEVIRKKYRNALRELAK